MVAPSNPNRGQERLLLGAVPFERHFFWEQLLGLTAGAAPQELLVHVAWILGLQLFAN